MPQMKGSPAPAPTLAQRERYWLSVTQDSPRESITFGGLTFHRTTYKPRFVDDSETVVAYDVPQSGQELELWPDQIQRVMDNRGRVALRIVSEQTKRSQVHRTDSPRYRPAPQDTPMERFLVLCKVGKDGERGPNLLAT